MVCIAAGLGVALAAAAPSAGTGQAAAGGWVVAIVCCVGVMTAAVRIALRLPAGRARAACFGSAAAIGYALTAALIKDATHAWQTGGVTGFFLAWQTYAFAAAGVCALFLLQNAVQSGPLVASQPALTLGDALVSLALGVTLYAEEVRTGWWLVPEIAGAGPDPVRSGPAGPDPPRPDPGLRAPRPPPRPDLIPPPPPPRAAPLAPQAQVPRTR